MTPPSARGGGRAGVFVALSVVADLIAVVSLPVTVMEGKLWSFAIIAGGVGVLGSLLYLPVARASGRWAMTLMALLLVAGLVAVVAGVVASLDRDSDGGQPPGGDGSTTGGGPPAHEYGDPLFTADFSLITSTSYDLDTHRTGYPGEGADIGLDSSSLYSPRGAGIAVSEGAGAPEGCPTEAVHYFDRVLLSDLTDGAAVCVVTTEGGLAAITVTAVGSNEITMTYALWQT